MSLTREAYLDSAIRQASFIGETVSASCLSIKIMASAKKIEEMFLAEDLNKTIKSQNNLHRGPEVVLDGAFLKITFSLASKQTS